MRVNGIIAVVLLVSVQVQVGLAVTLGQVDDFEDGTPMGWAEGVLSPNPPANVLDGGPEGVGDNYLENVADGNGAGGKLVMFNNSQWTGDYLAAGVTRIDVDVAALGSYDLAMRIAIEGNAGERYGSIAPVELTAGGQWHHVSFDLNAAELGLISGEASLEDVLANVTELRILSSGGCCPYGGPSWQGDSVINTFGVDNIKATQTPAPTVSAWGLVVMTLLLVAAGTIVIRRQRPAA